MIRTTLPQRYWQRSERGWYSILRRGNQDALESERYWREHAEVEKPETTIEDMMNEKAL